MGWQNGYYYRKKRQGKRIISEYCGTGYAGLLASLQDEKETQKRKAERERFHAQVERENAIDKQIDAIGAQVDALVTAIFLVSGYHQHKRQWRKKRMIRISAPAELSKAMRSGDRQAMQAAMAAYPEAAAQLGNLSIHTQATILHRVFGDANQAVMLAVNEHTIQVKQQLGYESSNPIEKAMIDHVLVCWLRLAEAETRYEALQTENNVTITRQEHWEKRLAMAQHRYLKAVESLAKVRRLLSAVPLAQINVNSQVLNAGSVQR